ncbi:MAG: STAS domain-containing protein [Chthoniobacterales bacterium]
MNIIPSISAACFDHDVWIRITGRGCFECSTNLKTYVKMMIEKGYDHYIIDLMDCQQMDSTFMGTITGIAQELRRKKKETLRVINVSEKNQQLMENLGLDQLFLIQPLSTGRKLPPFLDDRFFCTNPILCEENEKSIKRELFVSAHKALVSAHEANAAKFQNLFDLIC